MTHLITRNHTGHRVGECHQNAKYPDATVHRARELRRLGMSYNGIATRLKIPAPTVIDWCQYRTRWNA